MTKIEKIELPNIRKLFIPSPSHIIADCDLSGADAQVVAWEAGDEELKEAFRKGLDVHSDNAEKMMGTKFTSLSSDDPKRKKLRGENKIGVHLTNYGGSARVLSLTQGWTMKEAEAFQSRWFSIHPKIAKWHERVQLQLMQNKTIENKFGFTRTYFDRLDGLLPEALAWIPQSTVGLVCSFGMIKLEEQVPEVKLLSQVHDSVVFEFPRREWNDKLLRRVHSALTTVVPYDDPLTIPWGLALSSHSWGECKETNWPEGV